MTPSIEPTRRTVIEYKLLAALDDAAKAAIIVSKEDLNMLIAALEVLSCDYWDAYLEGDAEPTKEYPSKKVDVFVSDLKALRRVVFLVD